MRQALVALSWLFYSSSVALAPLSPGEGLGERSFSKWADTDSTTVFSASDTTYLRDIAMLCPYTAGPAVSLARTMLFAPTKEYFSLYNKCEFPAFQLPEERIGQESNAPLIATTVKVYPNPTTGKVNIAFNGQPLSGTEIIISGIDGKAVLTTQLNWQENEILLTLSPGIYLYNLRGPGLSEQNGKLVIVAK